MTRGRATFLIHDPLKPFVPPTCGYIDSSEQFMMMLLTFLIQKRPFFYAFAYLRSMESCVVVRLCCVRDGNKLEDLTSAPA